MITIKNYVSVNTVEEAYELNKKKNNVILGGMCWLKMLKRDVNVAIDLSNLDVNSITEDDQSYRIGAYVTLRDLEVNESLNTYTNGGMKKCVEHIVGVQFRNCATIGGSIWGRFGFSDLLTFFMAMDAKVELYPTGVVSMKEFSEMKFNDDILLAIIVDKKVEKIAYQTIRNQSTDFPVLTCATSVIDGKGYACIGARPVKAIRYDIDLSKDMDEISTSIMEQVETKSNGRASAEYRKRMTKVLVRRCLKEMEGI